MRVGTILAVVGAAVLLVASCTLGGKEGDRCNPLVLRDECNAGLRCTTYSCSESYCCPTDHPISDPHCNGPGCPADDASADAAAE